VNGSRIVVATKAVRALAVSIRQGAQQPKLDARAIFADVATALERVADAIDTSAGRPS